MDRLLSKLAISRAHPKVTDDGICFISFYVFNGRHTSFGGFFGKWFIFLAAIEAQLYTLAIIGVISSVVAAFYYLRIIKIMYFDEIVDP